MNKFYPVLGIELEDDDLFLYVGESVTYDVNQLQEEESLMYFSVYESFSVKQLEDFFGFDKEKDYSQHFIGHFISFYKKDGVTRSSHGFTKFFPELLKYWENLHAKGLVKTPMPFGNVQRVKVEEFNHYAFSDIFSDRQTPLGLTKTKDFCEDKRQVYHSFISTIAPFKHSFFSNGVSPFKLELNFDIENEKVHIGFNHYQTTWNIPFVLMDIDNNSVETFFKTISPIASYRVYFNKDVELSPPAKNFYGSKIADALFNQMSSNEFVSTLVSDDNANRFIFSRSYNEIIIYFHLYNSLYYKESIRLFNCVNSVDQEKAHDLVWAIFDGNGEVVYEVILDRPEHFKDTKHLIQDVWLKNWGNKPRFLHNKVEFNFEARKEGTKYNVYSEVKTDKLFNVPMMRFIANDYNFNEFLQGVVGLFTKGNFELYNPILNARGRKTNLDLIELLYKHIQYTVDFEDSYEPHLHKVELFKFLVILETIISSKTYRDDGSLNYQDTDYKYIMNEITGYKIRFGSIFSPLEPELHKAERKRASASLIDEYEQFSVDFFVSMQDIFLKLFADIKASVATVYEKIFNNVALYHKGTIRETMRDIVVQRASEEDKFDEIFDKFYTTVLDGMCKHTLSMIYNIDNVLAEYIEKPGYKRVTERFIGAVYVTLYEIYCQDVVVPKLEDMKETPIVLHDYVLTNVVDNS